MAPTRIIYSIATYYILGFDPSVARAAPFRKGSLRIGGSAERNGILADVGIGPYVCGGTIPRPCGSEPHFFS